MLWNTCESLITWENWFSGLVLSSTKWGSGIIRIVRNLCYPLSHLAGPIFLYLFLVSVKLLSGLKKLFFLFCFWRQGFSVVFGACPGASSFDRADLELTEICLPLRPECAATITRLVGFWSLGWSRWSKRAQDPLPKLINCRLCRQDHTLGFVISKSHWLKGSKIPQQGTGCWISLCSSGVLELTT